MESARRMLERRAELTQGRFDVRADHECEREIPSVADLSQHGYAALCLRLGSSVVSRCLSIYGSHVPVFPGQRTIPDFVGNSGGVGAPLKPLLKPSKPEGILPQAVEALGDARAVPGALK